MAISAGAAADDRTPVHATFAGPPAISVPAGSHPNGRWPVGLQLIGRPNGDAALLRAAAACEFTATELLRRRPPELGIAPARVPAAERRPTHTHTHTHVAPALI